MTENLDTYNIWYIGQDNGLVVRTKPVNVIKCRKSELVNEINKLKDWFINDYFGESADKSKISFEVEEGNITYNIIYRITIRSYENSYGFTVSKVNTYIMWYDSWGSPDSGITIDCEECDLLREIEKRKEEIISKCYKGNLDRNKISFAVEDKSNDKKRYMIKISDNTQLGSFNMIIEEKQN